MKAGTALSFNFVPMSSLPFFRTVPPIALIALILGFQNHSRSAAPTASPNVVIILTDDLGYGDLSAYGQEAYETPEIDRLAREGVLATDYYVPVPYCAPSRAALLTGRFPFRNGMVKNPHPDLTEAQDNVGLRADELTLGEVYQSAGYQTAAFGKWHLGHKPRYLSARDLNPDWVDPKWPNGTTIIAQEEQPNSMAYPGVVPEEFENSHPLFNLATDPTESTDLAAAHPEVVARLRTEYERFLASMPVMD
jgi:arylsulfatase A-like enzyme